MVFASLLELAILRGLDGLGVCVQRELSGHLSYAPLGFVSLGFQAVGGSALLVVMLAGF